MVIWGMVYYWFTDIILWGYSHASDIGDLFVTKHSMGMGYLGLNREVLINKMVVCHGNTMGKPTMIYGNVIFGLHVISDIGGSLTILRDNVML